MNKRVVAALYFALLAAIVVSVAFFAVHAGCPFWLSGLLASLSFIFINGSLAYAHRARKLKMEGKPPPPYLMYLFFPEGISSTVQVPRLIRVILGLPVFLGGSALVLLDGLFLAHKNFSAILHSFGAIALHGVLMLFGAIFMYIGIRLFLVKDDERLFERGQTPPQ